MFYHGISSKKKPHDNEIKESAKKQKKITDARDSASSCLSYLMSEQSSEGRTTNEGGGEEKNVGSSDMPLSPKGPDVPEDLFRALDEGFAIIFKDGRWQKEVVTKESIETDFGPCPGIGITFGKCRNRRFVLPSRWVLVRGLQHVDGAVDCLAPARRQQMQFVI